MARSMYQEVAAVLTDAALAARLERLAQDIRAESPQQRKAYLIEAAKRLRNNKEDDG